MTFIKKNLGLLIFLLLGLFLTTGLLYKRYDLTSDKRYTLTDTTRQILSQVEEPMEIEVYLDGDFPADFKQLQSETLSLLDEMKTINPTINYKLVDPIKEKISQDSLQAMNMYPSALRVEKEGVSTQIILFPYAVIKYKGKYNTVPLIVEQGGALDEQMTKSVESLEYNFVNAVSKLTKDRLKSVGILVNQKELNRLEMYSFAIRIIQSYNFGPIFPKDSQSLKMQDLANMKRFDAIVIAKPRKAFTEEEKMTIDQYIMGGGKTLWAIDQVNAEMDTLLKSTKILAYPYDLNLTDMLFSYGVRINSGVIKDIQLPAYINLQVGEVQGNPQNKPVPWVYFPKGLPLKDAHPITKNINQVKFEFPSPIDTLDTPGVKKTILYQSSPYTEVQGIPSYISLEEAKVSDRDSINLGIYNKGAKIMAVLLEGNFPSAYADRIESSKIPDFIKQSKTNKMIVISDGDVARNQVIKGEPLPLGLDYSTGIKYGNEEFLINSLDYLLDDNGLMNLRNRTVQMRLLNKQTIVMEKSYWQWFNILVPIGFIVLIGAGFIMIRKKKYS